MSPLPIRVAVSFIPCTYCRGTLRLQDDFGGRECSMCNNGIMRSCPSCEHHINLHYDGGWVVCQQVVSSINSSYRECGCARYTHIPEPIPNQYEFVEEGTNAPREEPPPEYTIPTESTILREIEPEDS